MKKLIITSEFQLLRYFLSDVLFLETDARDDLTFATVLYNVSNQKKKNLPLLHFPCLSASGKYIWIVSLAVFLFGRPSWVNRERFTTISCLSVKAIPETTPQIDFTAAVVHSRWTQMKQTSPPTIVFQSSNATRLKTYHDQESFYLKPHPGE